MISFYMLPKRLFLKGQGLSNERVASTTTKEYSY